MSTIIVSGASSNHFKSLGQLVRSIRAVYPTGGPTLKLWDLGLKPEEVAQFQTEFGISLETFNYKDYPAFYDITVNAGQYAWKSAAIEKSIEGAVSPVTVLWLDAGNMLTAPIGDVFSFIRKQGLFTPMSGGRISELIHPLTLEATGKTLADFRGKTLRTGGIIGFYTGLPWVKEWFKRWRTWCDTESIIAPPGSDRTNHRQDQALLTITYWAVARQRGLNYMRDFSTTIKIHCDID